jgi:hypothetical protein
MDTLILFRMDFLVITIRKHNDVVKELKSLQNYYKNEDTSYWELEYLIEQLTLARSYDNIFYMYIQFLQYNMALGKLFELSGRCYNS